jgi:hypothetical protein
MEAARQGAGDDRPDAGDGLEAPADVAAAVPGMDLLLGGMDLRTERQELPRQTFQADPCNRRQPGILRIGNDAEKLLDLRHADRRDDAELGHMGAHGVDQHGALANQQFARPVQHQDALLLRALA